MLKQNLLRGEKIHLTLVTKEDLPTLVQWYQDADFLRLYDSVPAGPQTEEQLAERISAAQKSDSDFIFAIRPIYDDDLLGLVELDGIQWNHGTAALSIAIGDAGRRGQGYGREAMALILRFAFHELNLHRVFLTVFAYNQAAIALYEQLGFRQEGVYREHLQRDGERHDMLLYGLLRHEWKADDAEA